MKRFRFPLRSVAVLRAHQQARARDAFAVSVQAYVRAEQHLAALQARRQDLETVMHDGRRKTFQAADEVSFWGAYRLVCTEEAAGGRALSEVRTKREEARQAYLEAHRAVKVVEKLEFKARSTHRLQADREAQLELDELAGLRIARGMAATTHSS